MSLSRFRRSAGMILSAALLAGCAASDIAELNKKVSDMSYDLLSVGKKTGNNGGGLPTLSTNTPVVDKKTSREWEVPVDVDSAAARVKRYYGFSSSDEVNRLKTSNSNNDRWVAASITDGAYAWDAQPGAYYKMGKSWGADEGVEDNVLIELEKNGLGSRMYITFRSSEASHVTEAYTSKLFTEIKQVAEGKVR
ncbi:hypothetical protein [Serratia fonticola]|uniref:Lipoprotein n=1 Tax=Serratia fonticola TaxID=47917 RepID=A0AAW3WJK6_SERFO|nr:hypothetical protein [Serratia fonticola]MBC3211069.1 hypothetical protein [Serratia fonticola]NYA12051.1 hypothetical protein [Serratia fonticola]NYA31630.1 hypothetical protein [Serratia fonticola]